MDRTAPFRHPKGMSGGKDWKRLGNLVLAGRADMGISQEELAARMNVVTKTVRTLEKGRAVSSTTVARVDAALGLPIGTARQVLEDGVDPTGLEFATEPTDEPAPAPRSRPRPEVPNKGDLTEQELEFMWSLSKLGLSAEKIVETVRQRRARNQLQSGVDVGHEGENSA